MRKFGWLCGMSLVIVGLSAVPVAFGNGRADLGPTGPDVYPDPDDPGTGPFPNVKTQPLATSDQIVVNWALHFQETHANLAGLRFQLHYDANELDVIHVGGVPDSADGNVIPLGPQTPGGQQHGGFSQIRDPLLASEWVVDPPLPGTINATATFTGWVPPEIANASGLNVPGSLPYTFAAFQLHARHTSLTGPFNSDFDFRVSQITPIFHAKTTMTALFTVWRPSLGWLGTNVIHPSNFYLGPTVTGVHAWLGLEHVPEPVTGLLMLGGLGCLLRSRKRRPV